jgi:hypothetical protein
LVVVVVETQAEITAFLVQSLLLAVVRVDITQPIRVRLEVPVVVVVVVRARLGLVALEHQDKETTVAQVV